MISLFRNSIFAMIIACAATACNDHIVYHSYQTLPVEGWKKNDTLFFQIPVTDSVPTTFRLFAEARNKSDFPYRDLYLFINQNLLDSTVWKTDTVTIHIADSTGRWLGSGWSNIYQSETFIKSVRSLHSGNRFIKITSGMKDENLSGLNDIGIRIEKQ